MRIGGGPIHQQLQPANTPWPVRGGRRSARHPGEQAIHRREEHGCPSGYIARFCSPVASSIRNSVSSRLGAPGARPGSGVEPRLLHASLLPGWRCKSTGESKKQAPRGPVSNILLFSSPLPPRLAAVGWRKRTPRLRPGTEFCNSGEWVTSPPAASTRGAAEWAPNRTFLMPPCHGPCPTRGRRPRCRPAVPGSISWWGAELALGRSCLRWRAGDPLLASWPAGLAGADLRVAGARHAPVRRGERLGASPAAACSTGPAPRVARFSPHGRKTSTSPARASCCRRRWGSRPRTPRRCWSGWTSGWNDPGRDRCAHHPARRLGDGAGGLREAHERVGALRATLRRVFDSFLRPRVRPNPGEHTGRLNTPAPVSAFCCCISRVSFRGYIHTHPLHSLRAGARAGHGHHSMGGGADLPGIA